MGKRKEVYNVALFVLLSMALVLFLGYGSYPTGNAAWWDYSWQYRQNITVYERAGETLADYQVKIILNTSALIFAGKMKADCGDIRLVSGGEELSYWIEEGQGCGQWNTSIWVKVPSIPANSSALVSMYYGNPSTAGKSSGANTFLFFDDFSGGSLDQKWGLDMGSVNVSGGFLQPALAADTRISSLSFDTSKAVIEMRTRVSSTEAIDNSITAYVQGSNRARKFFMGQLFVTRLPEFGGEQGLARVYTNDGEQGDSFNLLSANNFPYRGGNWYTLKYSVNSANHMIFLNDIFQKSLISTKFSSGHVGIRFGGQTAAQQVDWFFVRKYSAAEPHVAVEFDKITEQPYDLAAEQGGKNWLYEYDCDGDLPGPFGQMIWNSTNSFGGQIGSGAWQVTNDQSPCAGQGASNTILPAIWNESSGGALNPIWYTDGLESRSYYAARGAGLAWNASSAGKININGYFTLDGSTADCLGANNMNWNVRVVKNTDTIWGPYLIRRADADYFAYGFDLRESVSAGDKIRFIATSGLGSGGCSWIRGNSKILYDQIWFSGQAEENSTSFPTTTTTAPPAPPSGGGGGGGGGGSGYTPVYSLIVIPEATNFSLNPGEIRKVSVYMENNGTDRLNDIIITVKSVPQGSYALESMPTYLDAKKSTNFSIVFSNIGVESSGISLFINNSEGVSADVPLNIRFVPLPSETTTTTLSCPVCPEPSGFSACVSGKQSREVYSCSPETGYTCKKTSEERTCETPLDYSWLFWLLLVIIVAAVAAYEYRKHKLSAKHPQQK